jgi:hypothetical protein
MPLSDLFKKPSKKEPEKTPADKTARPPTDESLLSPEMQKKRYEAALEFVKLFQEKIPLVGGKPHAGTVLAVAARLAGSSLYRSLNYKKDIAPGVVVLSDEVNEAWPQLMDLFAHYCRKNGFDVMSKPVITQFPEGDKPRMEVDEVLAEYQDQFHEIMKKHGLDYLNAARAGIVVCSIVFMYHCKSIRDIDPYVAAGIVAMGIVEGAKTAPPVLGAHRTTKAARNEDRLVLGEQNDAIQEALAHGGAFIDLNPEVVRSLQEAHLDPYIIYEQAVLNKIEEKIGRIDFVKVNVEELFEEWKGKLYDQAPIHVRMVMWLKKHASTLGYEQSGNSWILKR